MAASWREYEGGVQDWLTQSRRSQALAQAAAVADARSAAPAASPPKPAAAAAIAQPKKKLSYKEQRELETLPALIETLEQEQKQIHEELADGELYGSNPARAALLGERSAQIDDELMAALERWEMLGSAP